MPFKLLTINLHQEGHGLSLGDKVQGQVGIDVEDQEKLDRIAAVYEQANQQAQGILKEPAKK